MVRSRNFRIQWVDFLKGIAIMWLMVYHFYVFEWLRSPVVIFFFLSGLFFSEGTSFPQFIKKKVKAILIPFAFFYALGIIALLIGTYIAGESFVYPPFWTMAGLLPLGVANPLGVGAIWFLVSLFEIYVIYYLIRKVSVNKLWAIIFGLCYFISSALFLERYANSSFFYLLYTGSFFIIFEIGHLYKDKILNETIPLWVLVVCVIGYMTTYIEMGGVFCQG